MGDTKEGAAEVAGAAPSAAVVVVDTKAETAADIRADLTALQKVIAEQKAKGEITAASESTLQALYEEMKSAREDLATLKELRAKFELVMANVGGKPADKFKRWLPW